MAKLEAGDVILYKAGASLVIERHHAWVKLMNLADGRTWTSLAVYYRSTVVLKRPEARIRPDPDGRASKRERDVPGEPRRSHR